MSVLLRLMQFADVIVLNFLELNKHSFSSKLSIFSVYFFKCLCTDFCAKCGLLSVVHICIPLLFYFRTWLIVFQLIKNSGMAVRYL